MNCLQLYYGDDLYVVYHYDSVIHEIYLYPLCGSAGSRLVTLEVLTPELQNTLHDSILESVVAEDDAS